MADHAFFYPSENGDRKYQANSFSDWLKKFFTTGVFQGDLQVTADSGMGISVAPGYTNIGGKVMIFDSAQSLTIETAHATYPRIDTVVVERNDTDRDITLKVVKGGYSSNPEPTAPVRASGIYQLVLAEIYVAAGATAITQAVITDKRADTTVCGLVYTPVNTFDFGQFSAQFDAFIAEFKLGRTASFDAWMAQQESGFENWSIEEKSEYEAWISESEEDFNEWLETIRGILDEETAGHLQNEIDEHESRLALLEGMVIKNEITAPIDLNEIEGDMPILLTDDLGVAIVADWQYQYA